MRQILENVISLRKKDCSLSSFLRRQKFSHEYWTCSVSKSYDLCSSQWWGWRWQCWPKAGPLVHWGWDRGHRGGDGTGYKSPLESRQNRMLRSRWAWPMGLFSDLEGRTLAAKKQTGTTSDKLKWKEDCTIKQLSLTVAKAGYLLEAALICEIRS